MRTVEVSAATDFLAPVDTTRPDFVRTFAARPDSLLDPLAATVAGAHVGPSTFPTPSLGEYPIGGVTFGRSLAITFDRASTKPFVVQSLAHALQRMAANDASEGGGGLFRQPLGHGTSLELWSDGNAAAGDAASRVVNAIREGPPSYLESLSTPKLYGNKLRLSDFVAAALAATVPPGEPILDLMCGSGSATRVIAKNHPVCLNDGNAYASLLGRGLWLNCDEQKARQLLERTKEPFERNATLLREAYAGEIARETEFLHSDPTPEALSDYRAFCQVPMDSTPVPATAFSQCTRHFANAYFGVVQAIEFDALRAGIETIGGDKRELLLNALVLAMTVLASGPHFAQPPRITTVKQMRRVWELRSRSAVWEFEVALLRLSARDAPRQRLIGHSTLDWRQALDFHQEAETVYVDPPYSRLQYSRYYHVLNTMLAYQYVGASHAGRYPPKETRFSSRFESQPSSAERELSELIRTCADRNLHLIVSYADRSSVSMDRLIAMVRESYRDVVAFSHPLRHHSQGVKLSSENKNNMEYIISGSQALG